MYMIVYVYFAPLLRKEVKDFFVLQCVYMCMCFYMCQICEVL